MKDVSNCQKMIDIARSRGVTMIEIVHHDIFNFNPLFEGDDTYKPDKHILTKELEKLVLEKPIFVKSVELHTALVIDFMSLLRRLPIGKMNIFKDLLQAAWKSSNIICTFQRLDIIFEGERQRRSNVEPLEYVGITEDTKIPIQLERFWASAKNKELLQTLCRDFLISVSTKEKVNKFLIGSVPCSYQIVDCIEVNHEERSIVHDELNSTIEEADMQIIPPSSMVQSELLYCQMTQMLLSYYSTLCQNLYQKESLNCG